MMWPFYDVLMRTTVSIDDDVLAVARALAEQQGIVSLGRALSELARRGFRSGRHSTRPGVFDVGPDAVPITSEDVREGMSDFP